MKNPSSGKRRSFRRWPGLCGMFFLSTAVILMLAGFYISPVPIEMFYLGYLLVWVSFPFLAGAWKGWKWTIFAIIAPFLLAFISVYSPILPFPLPSVEKGYTVHTPPITVSDDKLQEKNPKYIPAFTRPVLLEDHGLHAYCNKSASVVGIDLGEIESSQRKVTDRLYPSFSDAKRSSASLDCDFLPSIDLVGGYSKSFDDKLLAALEEHISRGSGIFPGGKQGFLKSLLAEILRQPQTRGRDEAAAYIAAASILGGDRLEAPEPVVERAELLIRAFKRDQAASRPVGFYSESPSLSAIFQRDRFLQKPFRLDEDLHPAAIIATSIGGRPDLLTAYRDFRILSRRICNPDANLNMEDLLARKSLFSNKQKLREALKDSGEMRRSEERGNINPETIGIAFWPFAMSKETQLFAYIYGTEELPDTRIMDDLAEAVKSGSVKMAPGADSGWYDYKFYALEPLVLPERAFESQKLLLHSKYKKRLSDTFAAMMTRNRESHIKFLFQNMAAGFPGEPMPLSPRFSLEPCATYYLRTARGYRFLSRTLRDLPGSEDAEGIRINGSRNGLLTELDRTTALFYGFYIIVCNDIGMLPDLTPSEIGSLPWCKAGTGCYGKQACPAANSPGITAKESEARFRVWAMACGWLKNLDAQMFMGDDVRAIAPVMSNARGTRYRNWATLGVRLLKIKAYYARRPRVGIVPWESEEKGRAVDPEEILRAGKLPSDAEWEPKEYMIPVLESAEVTLGPRPMTRTEFRALCDRRHTKAQILRSLSFGWYGAVIRLSVALLAFVLLAAGVKRFRLRTKASNKSVRDDA